MLSRAPKYLPPLSVILQDLGAPKPASVAQTLGVTERTVKRWMREDQAPRAALMALFWLTRYGVSIIEADAHNELAMHAGMVSCLRTENAALAKHIQHLLRIGAFGSANAPIVDIRAFHPSREVRRPQLIEPLDCPACPRAAKA
jgi:hypothetical protein